MEPANLSRRLWLIPLSFVLYLSSLILHPSTALAHDWPQWRGPEQNGVSREVDLPAQFALDPQDPDSNLLWQAPYGIRSTPIVMNGRVYINNRVGEGIKEQERVMCLDADTGKVLWEKLFGVWHTDIVSVRLGWANLAGDPATGNIYWHGTQGLFVCFDQDGKILWQRSLTEEFGRISGYGGRVNTPVVDEDRVIIGMLSHSWGSQAAGADRYLAMDKNNGKILWWWESPNKPKDTYYSTPVVAVINGQRLLITGGGDGFVHAIKARTGEHLWSFPLSVGGINPSPVVDGNLVYIAHGAENLDTYLKGGVYCLDGSKVKDGKPEVVWKKYGIEVQYTSPILHNGRLYVCTDLARMYCLDAKTGKQLWRLSYGRNAMGSPVWADGKIYVGSVNSLFHIIEDGEKKPKILYEQFFPSADEITDVELNGTPAVANGRVYFGTTEALYCIGKKEHTAKAQPIPPLPLEPPLGRAAALRIEPAEVTLQPGDRVVFQVRVLDDNGRVLPGIGIKGLWSLAEATPPPKAKAAHPALKGKIVLNGFLILDAQVPNQEGLVQFTSDKLGTATARVRVAPRLPYREDFDKVPEGLAPAGWINTQGKFSVVTLKDGARVLRNNNKVASPLVARANAYLGLPGWKNYTIEADVMCTQVGNDLPDMGVIAHRYRLVLFGNLQQLRIDAWDAIPRVAVTIPFPVEPNVWYRFKLKVQREGDKALLYGKAWPREQAEPEAWQIEFADPNPIPSGSPALYSYTTGILEERPGTDVYFDNVRVTPNDGGGK